MLNSDKRKIMHTELLMTIDFILQDTEKTKRIAGGAETHWPTDDLRWLDFTGKNIMIRTDKKDLYFTVTKIDISTSIWGAINIALTIDADAQFDAVHRGDKVFKIINAFF